MIKVFFDTSVLFSAIFSPTGGSHQLCQLVKDGEIKGYTSQTAIKELQTNISKFPKEIGANPEKFVAEYKFIVRNEISAREIKPYQKYVVEKDAHILAGAVLCRCEYIVTLDKKHIDNELVKDQFTNVIITSPKELSEYLRS